MHAHNEPAIVIRFALLMTCAWLSLGTTAIVNAGDETATPAADRPTTKVGPKLVVQSGHTGSVSSVAFSPRGRQVVTGSDDHRAVLWDATTGSQLRTLLGLAASIESVAFSADGRLVLAAGGSFAEFLSLAPTAGKAAMVLGGASALGILAPSGPTPRHLGSVLGGVGLLACGVGGAVAGLSLGLGMPASAGLALLAGTAGALGGYRLASAGTGLIARLPSRAPHEPTVDPRQAVSDLVNRLRVPRATILEESERQVVIGGVKVRRRQAPPPGLK